MHRRGSTGAGSESRWLTGRMLVVVAATAVACTLLAGYVAWLMSSPPSVASSAGAGRRTAGLTLQTVASLGPRYAHPEWVSYLVRDAQRDWIHSTNLTVPAHSLVRATIYQFDTATGLRNPYFARVEGTTGARMEVDGKAAEDVAPASTSHTFAIPQLGVYVPLPGVSDDAKNQCTAAPCTQGEAHRTVTFSFRTQGRGRFRWQCFVPCGAGFQTGFGGPMQAFGYMNGYLTVV